MFSLALCHLRASRSAHKNIRIILEPCPAWKCVPTAISGYVDITEVPGCHYVRWVLSEGHKNYFKDSFKAYLSVFNLSLTQWIMAMLSKGCKADNFDSHSSLKLSFANICGDRSNFVECKSFLESNSSGISFPEENLDDSIDSGNFGARHCLPLIWKDSITHTYGLAVYLKKGLPFAQNVSLEKLVDFYVFGWLYFTLCPTFFIYRSTSSSLCTFETLSINPPVSVFVFWDFNTHHRNWLTYSGGTDRPGELCYNSQMTLLRWLTFLLGSQTMTLTVPLFWIYFFGKFMGIYFFGKFF